MGLSLMSIHLITQVSATNVSGYGEMRNDMNGGCWVKATLTVDATTLSASSVASSWKDWWVVRNSLVSYAPFNVTDANNNWIAIRSGASGTFTSYGVGMSCLVYSYYQFSDTDFYWWDSHDLAGTAHSTTGDGCIGSETDAQK